jgi:predicted acetyltransferase
VSVEIRSIVDDELEAWVEALNLGFHTERPSATEATYRREVIEQDLGRTLAAFDGQRVVGTLSSFPAELSLPGSTCVAADAVSAVSVLSTHRRRGLLTRMIEADLRAARDHGEVASILIAAEYPIYGRFGYGPAVERAAYTIETQLAHFTRRSSGSVELVHTSRMHQLAPGLFDRFRRDRPGQIDRHSSVWVSRLQLKEVPWTRDDRPVRCALYSNDQGQPEGYLVYRVEPRGERHLPASKLEVTELIALSTDAYAALWAYCCNVDLVRQVTAGMRIADEPLAWLLDNPRAAIQQTERTDFLWVRPHDVERMFSARRYGAEARVVLEVHDPLEMSGGRFALEGGPHGGVCRATRESADLGLGISMLGAISLGGVNLHVLAAAGLIDEVRAGSLDQAERLFRWPITPWCSTFF